MKNFKKIICIYLAVAMLATAFCTIPTTAAEPDINFGLNAITGKLDFENDAEYPWAYNTSYIGYYGAASGNAGVPNSTSTVSTTVTFNENQAISFKWKASCQEKWDTFTFYVDGVAIETISGNTEWEEKIIAIPAGEHVLSWSYSKDEIYNLFDDKGYLDEVEVVNAPKQNIDSLINAAGSTFTYECDSINRWTNYYLNGKYIAKSSIEGKGGISTAITLRETFEKGKILSFSWMVDCENVWDRFVFEVNGKEVYSITGKTLYETKKYIIPEDGEYVIRWVYMKDSTNNRGADSAYLGNVALGDYIPVTGVNVIRRTSVAVGNTANVICAVKPSNATNTNVIWESSDESIATVDNNGIVSGVSMGTVILNARSEEGGFTGTCEVTVLAVSPAKVYYVDPAKGKDSNKGTSTSGAFATLKKAVEASHTTDGLIQIILLGDVSVSTPIRVNHPKINIQSKSGKTYRITRAKDYRGPIFNVALGGGLYLGNTANDGGVSVGHSEADAPAILVDMGTLYFYEGSEISDNVSTLSGGGIYLNEGEAFILGGRIIKNSSARYGGGIYVDGGKLTVYNGSSVEANSAEIYGGGIYVDSDATAVINENVSISGNAAKQGYGDICFEEELPSADKEYVSKDGRYTYRIIFEKNGIEIIGWQPHPDDALQSPDMIGVTKSYNAEIPAQIDGYNVISVGKNAFREYDGEEFPLGRVVIPATVKEIGYGAFRECKQLFEVVFGGNEISVGDYAFYMCPVLRSVELPETLESLGYGALSYCAALETVTVPNAATAIGEYAFYESNAELVLRGHYPSTAYDYATANAVAFEDIIPYVAPTVSGIADGESYNMDLLPEGVAISWDSPYETTATLNGDPYVAGTCITTVGDYIFTVSDGRTTVTINFSVTFELAYTSGDVDFDGKITVSDALLTLRIAARIVPETEKTLLICDRDGDGAITVADALNILRAAIARHSSAPEEDAE